MYDTDPRDEAEVQKSMPGYQLARTAESGEGIKNSILNIPDDELKQLYQQKLNPGTIQTQKPLDQMSNSELQALHKTNVDSPWDKIVNNVLGGATKFANSAVNEAIGMGGALGRGETNLVNKVFGSNLQAPNIDEVKAATTGKTSDLIERAYGNNIGTKVGDFLGSMAPYAAIPMSGVSGLASKGAAASLTERALLGGTTGALADTASGGNGAYGLAAGGIANSVLSPIGYKAYQGVKSAVGGITDAVKPYITKEVQTTLNSVLEKDLGELTSDSLKNIQGTAKGIIDNTKSVLQKTASSLYEKAYPTKLTGEDVSRLNLSGPQEERLGEIIDRLKNGKAGLSKEFNDIGKTLGEDTLGQYDLIKREAYTLGKKASGNAKDGGLAQKYYELAGKITDMLDSKSPAYTFARAAWSEGMSDLENMSSSPMGKLLNSKTGELGNSVKKIFNEKIDPSVRGELRDAFANADLGNYKQMFNTYLQKGLDDIKLEGQPNFNNFYDKFLSTPAKKQMMLQMSDVPGMEPIKDKLMFMTKAYDSLQRRQQDPGFIAQAAKAANYVIPSGIMPEGLTNILEKIGNKSDKEKFIQQFNSEVSQAITTGKYNRYFPEVGKGMPRPEEVDRFFNLLGVAAAKEVGATEKHIKDER